MRAIGRVAVLAAVAAAAATFLAGDEPGWPRPRSDERKAERERMVRTQIAGEGVTDTAVLDALRNVPRHWFVPADLQAEAYADGPLPIGHGQTISQPYIVALMTQLLRAKPDSRVLEIGTGSGYQAAVLNELTPHVFTIEVIRELADPAAKRLKDRGYTSITTKTGDGYYGWKEHAPFDAIIVTAASAHIPPPLLEQLKNGGRMVIPVGAPFRIQELMLVEKDAKGKIATRVVGAVRFVPLTGGPGKKP